LRRRKVRKASLSNRTLLRKNGYSENIIEEIYRWYSSSGTNS